METPNQKKKKEMSSKQNKITQQFEMKKNTNKLKLKRKSIPIIPQKIFEKNNQNQQIKNDSFFLQNIYFDDL